MARRQVGPVEAFSSAGLLALAARALGARDPALLPRGFATPDPLRAATAPAASKAGLLDHALAVGGPVPILSIGQVLGELRGSPTMDVLAASGSVEALADMWNRFGRYHHARNRAELSVGDGDVAVRRYAETGPPPSPAENVFIAGVLVALIGMLPVRHAELRVGDWRGAPPDWPEGLPVGECDRFRIFWGDAVETTAGAESATPNGTVRGRLARVLATDTARGWRVDTAARALGMSPRSLQRWLGAEGTRFSDELRRERVALAGRMLAGTGTPLAEVGFCCGYSDQAHFQREFRQVTNMTPGRYRREAWSGDGD